MKISIDINTSGKNPADSTEKAVQKVFSAVISRGTRAAVALRNSELRVLSGKRSGRVYRKPHTKKAVYTASAPGEPPAVRSGTLRRSFMPDSGVSRQSGSVTVRPYIVSDTRYAGYLEEGTRRMAPRPFRERVITEAKPEIMRIYSEPYLK